MDRQHISFLYIISFVVIAILLKATGVINLGNGEILSYALTFYGISLVFISFGTERRAALFLGSIVFLMGILFFIMNNFAFADKTMLIIPSIFYILGFSFLMLFLDETDHLVPLYISIVFLIIGLIFTLFWGSIAIISYFAAIPEIFIKALPIILIAILLIILLNIKRQK